ncbi:MAG: hypothetical protein A2314_09635 [Elusimicrobia bacterium RIFOXYB2_FULL_50_12]|nr:MAG: hypothetical protein A2314_09635 [Elusimicrobia bacterium RIFOXYB2_FULL_50_12]
MKGIGVGGINIKFNRNISAVIAFCFALTVVIFIIDTIAPRGTSVSLLHIIPLLLALRTREKKLYYLFPSYLTIITATAAFFKPALGLPLEGLVSNRTLAIFTFWVMSFLVRRNNAADELVIRSWEEFRTLAENMPDIVARYDREMRYKYINPAGARFFGLGQDEFTGKFCQDFNLQPDFCKFLGNHLKGVLRNQQEDTTEFGLRTPEGKIFYHVRLVPEFEKDGSIESILVIASDVTERRKAEDRIKFVSFHDNVTGLYNRAFFEEEIRRVDTPRNLPISIILGDVNFLKLTNDAMGHEEGDHLLKAVADKLRASCRNNDIIARWGGDEFAVILTKTDQTTAKDICHRVEHMPPQNTNIMIHPSVALGIATKGNVEQNIYNTIREAEKRMYENKLAESRKNQQKVISFLLEKINAKYPGRNGHMERSFSIAQQFGMELGLIESQMDDLLMLIRLHDIGKVSVPGKVLLKKEKLLPQEWDEIKRHSEVGFRVVKVFAETARIAEEVLAHGERWDGAGYPRGMKEKDIPYIARVFSLIDAFDAMTHERPYNRTFNFKESLEELRRNSGSQFDPELTEKFISFLEKNEEEFCTEKPMLTFTRENIPYEKVLARLGFARGKTKVDERTHELIAKEIDIARALARPRQAMASSKISRTAPAIIKLQPGLVIQSHDVFALLAECDEACGFAVTIGPQLEEKRARYISEKENTRALILDAIGSVLAEELAEHAHNLIECEARGKGYSVTRRFSPGYGDWHLPQQKDFLAWLAAGDIGIRLTDSFQMLPEKSVTALVGIKKDIP